MKNISRKTVDRALIYIRTLDHLIKEKRYLVSSKDLALITGISDVQIRKDISNFGKVGRPRIGYKTAELNKTLKGFVLQENVVHVALFGVGHLGTAMLSYPAFNEDNIKLVAAFEKDKSKIGKKINGVKVYPVEMAPKIIKRMHADLGIIAVPASHSQEVADIMVLSGLRGIVNFAPASISVPKSVSVKDIDFTIELLSLFCNSQR